MVVRPRAPRIPRILKPAGRAVYAFHFAVIVATRTLITVLYRHPLFQSRCASFGKNVSIDGLPFISGHTEIHIGDDVYLGGKIAIHSGRILEAPVLKIGNRAQIGWNTNITVNQEVIIEDDAIVAYDCRISDSDGHPRQADLRAQHCPPDPKDIRPVRICRNAWVGNGAHIMKGVTIGEGAVVGANSVVINDVPPYCLALGNPAEVFFRNYGKPSAPKRTITVEK
ncbi:MAG TPA: acyltransferase [Bryobacteraceae bacterium]|nr:acyltransferase [Bryobacteraceae bacterium]